MRPSDFKLLPVLLCLAFALPMPASAAEDEDVRGFVANVTVLRLVATEPTDGLEMYATKSFLVRLRSDHYIAGADGKRFDFKAVLQTNFDELPKRIYVVIDSERSRKVIHWTRVEEFFCVPPELAKTLERAADDRGAITIKGGSPHELCFLTP